MNRISDIKRNTLKLYQTKYNKTTLDNGLRIVTESIPFVNSISIGYWFIVGSRDESESTNGISHFLEHMVFKGTKDYTSKQIATQIEGYGGYINAFTGKETTCYYVRIMDEQLKRAIDVLSQLTLYPLLKEKDIEKEKSVVLEEIKSIEDDPEDLIHDVFDKNIFMENPIGYPVIGSSNNVQNFTRADLIQHLNKFYVPHNMVITAAGNIDHEKFVELLSSYFINKRTANGILKHKRIVPRKSAIDVIKQAKPIQQAHICTGIRSYSIRSKHRYAMMLLNTLVGEGMSSRLFQNIREKYGFTYSIGSFLNFYEDTGSFGVYTGTDKNHIEISIDLIYKELQKLIKIPVSKAELNRVKSQVKGTMMLGLENMSTRMMRLAANEIYFKDYISVESILDQLDAVTSDEIQLIAKDIFDIDKFTTVIFAPNI